MMSTTGFNKTRSNSLNRLPSLASTSPKLFQTKEEIMNSKKLLLKRLEDKDQPAEDEEEKDQRIVKNMRRSFIQFPKADTSDNFVPFKKINKLESKQILTDFPKLRAQSTRLKSFIKAEIIYNKSQADMITRVNDQRLKEERQQIIRRVKEMTPNKMKKQFTVKQKFQAKTKRVIGIKLFMNFDIYEKNLQIWKPFIDFDTMPIIIKDTCYFIGGRKQGPIITYCVSKNKWGELPIINGLKPFGDCAHCYLNGRLIFFGGYNYFQQGFSLITNSIKILDVQNQMYEEKQFDEKKVSPRAFHDQCIYGKYLIISGGLDKDSHFSNKIMTYQIQNGFWNQLTINKVPPQLTQGFAKHRTLPLFHKRKIYSIYNPEDIIEFDPDITEEGIYLFGGETGSGQLNSKMFIIRLGQPSINIIEPKIDGKPPIARRNTCMMRHQQFIIIHGGRNDQMRPFSLNSLHFLNLKTMNWIGVSGEKPPYRYCHSLSVISGDIVILGGKTHEGLSKQIFVLPYEEMIQYV